MCLWTGGYPDCTYPPEYAGYQVAPYTYNEAFLTYENSVKVMSGDYSWFGMKNLYNSMLMFTDY